MSLGSVLISALHPAAILAYLTSAACLLLGQQGARKKRLAGLLASLAILMQASALYTTEPQVGFRGYGFGIAFAQQFLFAVLVCLVLDARMRFRRALAWLCAAAAAGSVLALLPVPEREVPALTGMVGLHLGLATLAYGMFLVSFAQMMETALLARPMAIHQDARERDMSLVELEGVVFRNIKVGFAVLSLTILSGAAVFSGTGQGGGLTHKNLFALLTWVFCAVLLVGRWKRGWRGVVALRWFAASTACLVLSYLGTVFVLDLLLG